MPTLADAVAPVSTHPRGETCGWDGLRSLSAGTIVASFCALVTTAWATLWPYLQPLLEEGLRQASLQLPELAQGQKDWLVKFGLMILAGASSQWLRMCVRSHPPEDPARPDPPVSANPGLSARAA